MLGNVIKNKISSQPRKLFYILEEKENNFIMNKHVIKGCEMCHRQMS